MKHLFRRRAGAQSLTELALILPLLSLLLIGLIEFGFLLQAHVQVTSAAREAARAASMYPAGRYASFAAAADANNIKAAIPSCATGVEGWSLQQVINFAIVSRGIDSNG
jgi:Flp pilus assembly protein TadG